MNNNLTGSVGSYQNFPTPNTTDLSETSTSSSQPVDFQPFDSLETASNGPIPFIPHQFSNKNFYDADAQNPLLIQPDPDGETGPQPYGAAEQKIINRFFNKRLKELVEKSNLSKEEVSLIYANINSNIPLSDPKLAKLVKNLVNQAKSDTQKEARLPDSWDPQSTSINDWEPSLISPYSDEKKQEINQAYDQAAEEALAQFVANSTPALDSAYIEKIKIALISGKVSVDIAQDFITITKQATEAVQKTYGLSETWFKGTTDIEDWKPIYLGLITPTSINEARSEMMLENVSQILSGLDTAGQKVANQLQDSNQNVALDEFRRTITKAISDLKAVLRDMQLKDVGKSDEAFQLKMDSLKVRQEEFDKQLEAEKEQKAKEAKAQKISKVFKIVGPIIAAVTIVVGAILSIFGGVGVPLIAAGIAIGLAMMAYSIADGELGLTAKAIAAVNEFIAEKLPDNELAQKIVKMVLVAVVVLLLVIAIVVSAGAAAASIIGQVIKEVIKQAATQLIIMAILASNAIPELLTSVIASICKARGVEMDEQTKKILEIVTMVVTMIGVVVAMSRGQGGSASKTATDAADKAVKEAAIITQETRTAMQKVQDMATQALNKLASIPGKIGQSAKDSLQSMKEIGISFKNIPQYIREARELNALEKIIERTTAQSNRFEELLALTKANKVNLLRANQQVLSMTTAAVGVADGISRGVIGVQVAKLLEKVGEHQAAQDLIQAIIQMLEKLLANIQTGMDSRNEDIINLQRVFTKFYKGLDQNATKIFQALQA